ARLAEMRRPLQPDIRFGFSAGGALLGGQRGYLLSGGVGLGIPLSRLRDVEAIIGVQATRMLGLRPDYRQALLLGMRARIERRATPSAGGWTIGAVVEGGYGTFSPTDPGTFTEHEARLPYVQGGLRVGYTLWPNPYYQPFIGIEATGGTALSGPAAAGTRDPTTDPGWRRWFGLGFSLEASF